jgi:cell division protein FtsL
MLRIAIGLSFVLAIVSAFILYSTTLSTRRLELEVQAGEQRLEQLRSEIAVLKADRAFLARPTRIEPAALRLGLKPQPDSSLLQTPPKGGARAAR